MNQNKHKYPELEKLASVKEQSQELGEFLKWLKRKYDLCTFNERDEAYFPSHESIEGILADYFKIDMTKVEKERNQILESYNEEK